jgi:hypothetical protein
MVDAVGISAATVRKITKEKYEGAGDKNNDLLSPGKHHENLKPYVQLATSTKTLYVSGFQSVGRIPIGGQSSWLGRREVFCGSYIVKVN